MIGELKVTKLASCWRVVCLSVVPISMIMGCTSKGDDAALAAEEQYLEPLDEEILELFAEREMLDDPVHFRVFSGSGGQLIRTFVPPDLKPFSIVQEYDLNEEDFQIIGEDDPEQEYIEVIMRVQEIRVRYL